MESDGILKLAMDVGELMLKNGAETYRVEDTMRRILLHFRFTEVESFVVATGITASIRCEKKGIIAMVKRVHAGTNNLEKVVLANQFSRDICNGTLSIEDAVARLELIKGKMPYPFSWRICAASVTSACFGIMFRGHWLDALCALMVGALVYPFSYLMTKYQLNSVLKNIFIGFSIALTTILLLNMLPSIHYDIVIIASMMPYVPGLLLTNAIRDIMVGDFLSGVARCVEAVLISVSLALGVGVFLLLWMRIFGGTMI